MTNVLIDRKPRRGSRFTGALSLIFLGSIVLSAAALSIFLATMAVRAVFGL
ncbi:hypothetical protein SK224_08000 [Microbacterium sp. BG28]|uniref:hypothetical protein n=1 Tax=Microbacterium sp. BG28 TaxID=3097356 RepID=UPI002A5A5D87|nr:hypothetical protein [Microbacterium sp. BG28]MDY0829069.1 hypothetical protein [Microbacterium sp. BG28]